MTHKVIHWTEQGVEDFLYRIAADFITQLEGRMKTLPLSQSALAKRLGVSEGRVSQVFNNPGNLTLKKIIEYARALDMKATVVAYDDGDKENKRGPVNADIFRICWEKAGKPTDNLF